MYKQRILNILNSFQYLFILYILSIADGSLVFKKSYTFKEQDNTKNYSLGAICLDSSDGLFIASDFCVLHVDKNCDLINVMPTKIDPFAIAALNDGVTLVIVGRNKTAETYRVQYGIQ